MPPQFRQFSSRVRLEKRNQRLGWEFCFSTVFVTNQRLVGHLVLQFSLLEGHRVVAISFSKSFFIVAFVIVPLQNLCLALR